MKGRGLAPEIGKIMVCRSNYIWRVLATGLGFSIFGIGGILMGFLMFPLIHLISLNRSLAYRRCQYFVHLSFRLIIFVMKNMGVLSYELIGRDRLNQSTSKLIIANHPSLIDIVFIVAQLPQAVCAVKKAAWTNPFMAGVMWATGYIPNNDPVRFVDDCVRNIKNGQRMVIFPEGTRSIPGQPMKLRRGTATIIVKSRLPFTPIHITSDPSTLTKGEKWYQIPKRKVHFKILVGENYDPTLKIKKSESLIRSNRKVNEILTSLLSGDIEAHGQFG